MNSKVGMELRARANSNRKGLTASAFGAPTSCAKDSRSRKKRWIRKIRNSLRNCNPASVRRTPRRTKRSGRNDTASTNISHFNKYDGRQFRLYQRTKYSTKKTT
eukprot:CAMPEP_0179172216 /NCGR_PEP_ID=MMETSP0796-20121207/84928_1 /TAXON_ID=73915 /ORGANISM="Pyrodinium bahamense, Strain pbaha01" /LENGTH=103 /DNA_ID=CAMNT_0020875345 /DNA_START=75 /DNA_END=386 /DNA_ORIENTATION=+